MIDKNINNLLDNNKLDLLYKNNLFSIKSICKELGIWDNYSREEQLKLENFTKRDSYINNNFTYIGEYNNDYTYSEILRSGVDIIIDKINKYKQLSNSDVFVDIGSGCGKLILHMSIKTNIKTLIGVECVTERIKYSKYIKNKILSSNIDNVFFIEKDINDFNLDIATIVFINDICFDDNMVISIYDRLPKGCHFITSHEIPSCKLFKENFIVCASWGKLLLNYYIK
jgi:16S rRNA A1518/A1519 N6-dimethyltransferase RsmA/KsgA/DIM1 with predicted DNA glycosylase/AP lyase activity